MTAELDRRSFLKLSGITAAGLALTGSAATLAPEEALAASKTYGTNKSSTFRSRVLLEAGNMSATKSMKSFSYQGKTYAARDVQALAIDEVNKRYYITRNDPTSSKRAFILSAPLSATSGKQWKVVGLFEKNWLGHANSICAIPCGKGTRLLVATNSNKIRVVYVPDASKPSTGIKTSTWVCGSYHKSACNPRGLTYDRASKCVIARNGISKKNGAYYMKCFVFKTPTSAHTGTAKMTEKHYSARFEIEIPNYVTAPAGALGSKAMKCKVSGWGRQDLCYDGTYLYNGFSDIKSGKYQGNVQRNLALRWKIGSVSSLRTKYATQMKKSNKKLRVPYRYKMDRALFDAAVKPNKQGYEFEGFDCVGKTIFMVTNEAKNKTYDAIRSFHV